MPAPSIRVLLPRLSVAALAFTAACSSSEEPAAVEMPILFASTRVTPPRAYRVSTDGRNVAPLSALGEAGATDWAPDGRRVVFERVVSGHTQIFVGRADGSAPAVQVSHCASDCYYPSWSRDGGSLAWWSNYGPVPPATYSESTVVVVTDTTGGSARAMPTTLTHSTGHPGPLISWSPDGTRFVYSRGDLYAVTVSDGGETRLTSGALLHDPSWSRDGRIAASVGEAIVIFPVPATTFTWSDTDPSITWILTDQAREHDQLDWSPDRLHHPWRRRDPRRDHRCDGQRRDRPDADRVVGQLLPALEPAALPRQHPLRLARLRLARRGATSGIAIDADARGG